MSLLYILSEHFSSGILPTFTKGLGRRDGFGTSPTPLGRSAWSRLGHSQIPLKNGGVSFGMRELFLSPKCPKKTGLWFQTQAFFIFTPTWGDDPLWRAYVSNGLKPPTRKLLIFFKGHVFSTQKLPRWTVMGQVTLPWWYQLFKSQATSSQNWNDGWWLHIPEKRSNILKKGGH